MTSSKPHLISITVVDVNWDSDNINSIKRIAMNHLPNRLVSINICVAKSKAYMHA